MTADLEGSTAPNAVVWYKSKVLRWLAITAITHALTHYKLISQFTPDDIGSFVDEGLSALGFLATALAGYYRIKKPTPPIVTTQKKADQANSSTQGVSADPKVQSSSEKSI